MDNVAINSLCSGTDCIRLDTTYSNWWRCTLVWDSNEIFLGAYAPEYLLWHLIAALSIPWAAIEYKPFVHLTGDLVKWVLTLSEGYRILFISEEGDMKILTWTDDKGQLIRKVYVPSNIALQWCDQLRALYAANKLNVDKY